MSSGLICCGKQSRIPSVRAVHNRPVGVTRRADTVSAEPGYDLHLRDVRLLQRTTPGGQTVVFASARSAECAAT